MRVSDAGLSESLFGVLVAFSQCSFPCVAVLCFIWGALPVRAFVVRLFKHFRGDVVAFSQCAFPRLVFVCLFWGVLPMRVSVFGFS